MTTDKKSEGIRNIRNMFSEDTLPNKRKDEKIVIFLRRHPFVFFLQIILYGFLGLIPVILYYFYTSSFNIPEFGEGVRTILVLGASIYYLFIAVYLYTQYIDYYLDVWIVTTHRIINVEQKGLFRRFIAEHDLDVVQDVAVEMEGLFPTFLRYGDIHVQTAGATQYFIFKEVPNPFHVGEEIGDVVKEYKEKIRKED